MTNSANIPTMLKLRTTPCQIRKLSPPSPPISPDKSVDSEQSSQSFVSPSPTTPKFRRSREARQIRKKLFAENKENEPAPKKVVTQAYDSVRTMAENLGIKEIIQPFRNIENLQKPIAHRNQKFGVIHVKHCKTISSIPKSGPEHFLDSIQQTIIKGTAI